MKHGVGVATRKRKDGTDAIQNVEMSVIPDINYQEEIKNVKAWMM